ncbi:MAG: hypothetical protein GVY04_03435 [Cyanobacteria bacterium]|nr:hypothetical protein [Cyanobacteria bacterium GSL.Bin1]
MGFFLGAIGIFYSVTKVVQYSLASCTDAGSLANIGDFIFPAIAHSSRNSKKDFQ